MDNRIYAIVDATAFAREVSAGEILPEFLFSNILETNFDTLRYSICGDELVIKTDSEASAEYLRTKAAELNIPYTEYSHDEIITVMLTPKWTYQWKLPI